MIRQFDNYAVFYLERAKVVSLEYARRYYNCYCKDCREQLAKAIKLKAKLVIMCNNHVAGVVL